MSYANNYIILYNICVLLISSIILSNTVVPNLGSAEPWGSAGFFDESMYVRKYLNHFEIVINIILGICIPN